MSFHLARENAANLTTEKAKRLAENAVVIAVDPGEHGAAVKRTTRNVLQFRGLMDWEAIADMLQPSRGTVLLMEDQFLGVNPATSQETTWQSATLTGYLSALAEMPFTVVHIKPRIWQLAQQRRFGILDGKQSSRADGIKLALRELAENDPVTSVSVNKDQREGFASAYGILRWFEEIVARKGVTKCQMK